MPLRTKSFSSTLSDSEYNGKIRECENEIRRLLRERSKNLKDLALKDDELKKIDNKLQCVIRERTSLKASLITFEKENKDLRKSKDLLKAKVSVYDKVEKKKDFPTEIFAVTEKLIVKEHEIADLRIELRDVRREREELVVAVKEKEMELEKLKDFESENDSAKAQLSELEENHEILKNTCEEIQERLSEVLEKLAISEAGIIEMKDERSKLVIELATYQKELEAKEDESSKVADELRKENLALLDRVEDQTNKRQFQERLLSVELDNAHQKLASTENCTRALQDYKDALIGRVSSLKDSITDLEDQQTIDMQTIKSLKLEVANLSTQLAEKKKAIYVSNSEITALKEQIHDMQNVHAEGTEKINDLESKFSDFKLNEETLKGELLVTRLALQVAEGDINEHRKCLSEVQANLDCEMEEILKHQTLLEESKKEIMAKEHELEDNTNQLKEEICAKEVQISELMVEFNKQLEKQQSNIEELSREVILKETEFKDRSDQLQGDIDKKEREIKDLASRLDEQLQKHKTEMESLNLEASEKEAEFNSRLEQLMNEIKSKDVQIANLSAKVDSLILSAHSLKLRIQEEENENSELKEKLCLKEEQIDALKKKIVEIDADKQNLRESLTTIRTGFEEQKLVIATSINAAIQDVTNLKVAAEIKENEFVAMNAAKEKLEREIESCQVREERIVQENAELTSSLVSKAQLIVELKHSVSTLKEQAQVLIDEFMAKEADFESSRRSLESKLQSKETELVAALLKLQESHAAAETTVSSLRNNLTRMDAEKHDKEMLYLEMKNMRNILHDELRQTQRELNETETNLATSEATASNLLEKIEIMKTDGTNKEQQLKVSSERVLQLETELSTKVNDIKKLKEQLERKRLEADNLNAEVQKLRKATQEKEGEISELRAVIEQNEQLAKDKSLVEDLTTTMDELNRLLETSKEQQALIQEMNEERAQFEAVVKQQNQEIQLHTATIEWYSDREKELLGEFDILEAKSKEDEQETKKILIDTQKAFSRLEEKFKSYRDRKENEGRQNEAMVQALTNDYETKLKKVTAEAHEMSYWHKMYEDLVIKVGPFMEQLDAYEIERNVLVSKNQETTTSLEKLTDQYAKLIGHQNPRQKIHHMTNLKEEVFKLREENTKLRMDVLKYQKSAQRRDVPGSASRSARPGDSVKRFQQPYKENNGTPLRDRNYI